MSMRVYLLVCGLVLTGCASDGPTVRGHEEPREETGRSIPPGTSVLVRHALDAERGEAQQVFLPAELLEWAEWTEESLAEVGWSVPWVEAERVGEVEWVMARRPLRRGGRGGLTGRSQSPLLNPRGQPRPERLQEILLKVYARYPIPQLIGLNP
jgi:hypothetical protein